jgi:hypothetical protein
MTMALSKDLWRLAQDAVADVGNTYRAVLLQHTGWIAPRSAEQGLDPVTPEVPDGPSLFGRRSTIEIAASHVDRNKPLPKIEIDI